MLVNGEPVIVPGRKVRPGDMITYMPPDYSEPDVDPSYEVLFEDECLIAVNKSGNIPVHPSGVFFNNTLVMVLERDTGTRLFPVHRLDRETSGAILFAKDPGTASAVQKNFGSFSKSYRAVVRGIPESEEFSVRVPIGPARSSVVRKKREAYSGAAEEAFLTFYSEVKQIEKRDSVLTSKNQIDRLTRPGSSYFNLNPFEVLQMDPEATDEEIKKRFRQLSILVHPDKNQDDADRAQKAFEAVDKAYKLLLDQEQKKRALDVIQAGKEYVEHTVKEKKKQLKKDGKPPNVEEDDPEVFKQAVYKQTMKLFAELEIKRKEREAKEMHERKRQREEEIEAQEKAKREREWQKNFEESRDGRVDSWRNFQANTKGKKEKKNRTFLRPPKVKMEQRE